MNRYSGVRSNDAYYKNLQSGIISKRRRQAYEYLARATVKLDRPATSAEVWRMIADVYPQIPQHSINPRWAELVRHGVVQERGTVVCSVTGMECTGWEVIEGAIAKPIGKRQGKASDIFQLTADEGEE